MLDSIKGHIAGIVSVETLLSAAQSRQEATALAKRCRAQIAENEKQLAEKKLYKAGLYEHLLMGDLSKADYGALKAEYVEDAQRIQNAIHKLKCELEDLLSGGGERQAWLEQFQQMASLTTLDRRTVVYLVYSIKVLGKASVEITFNYQPEFGNAVENLNEEVA